jgi:DNA polymerase IV
MLQAPRRCPHDVIIASDMDKYVRTRGEGRQPMQELTPLVEPLSIDEASMDLGSTARLHAAKLFVRFAARVETATGITVSIGRSFNKLLGKIASDHDKPRGFAVVGRQRGSMLSGAPTSEPYRRRAKGAPRAVGA